MTSLKNMIFAGSAGLLLAASFAAPAMAQRSAAYTEARANGSVGEKMDGYLGIVVAETPQLRQLVNNINIKRRAVYAEQAQENNATLEEYALTVGCQQILRTKPGEKYQAPDGSWQTRTSAPPIRDPRCPA
ncbi:MAG: YdbL family protein [Pseudomonadota bacterium]